MPNVTAERRERMRARRPAGLSAPPAVRPLFDDDELPSRQMSRVDAAGAACSTC
jgi:hypothetical protein